MTDEPRTDELRDRLLAAARRVFARKGFEGTRIGDIVRESELSTGAVYGRFESKHELLRSAVVERAAADVVVPPGKRVADLLRAGARWNDCDLSTDEAIRLEAYVVARREPQIADALHDANYQWQQSLAPMLERARADGSLSPDVTDDAALLLIRTIVLGLTLQRGAGIKPPDPAAWDSLMTRVVASLSDSMPPAPTGADEHQPSEENP